MHAQMLYDFAVRLNETGGVRRIEGAGVGHADPEEVAGGAALHRLAHDVVVDRGAGLTSVVKGLENTIYLQLF